MKKIYTAPEANKDYKIQAIAATIVLSNGTVISDFIGDLE